MANIDKELHQIKHAVYGRDVRGSIHDGIDKINKESEDSKSKATEAHDVMESIMTEGFDNAALEANFEKKLDDEIANLHPEITRVLEKVATAEEIDSFKRNESMICRKQKRRAMLTITDDDGWSGVYTTLFKLAKEYNVPFTSAMITSRPMGFPGDDRPYNHRYVHYNEWIEMRDSGLIEIVSHTHNHQVEKKLTEISDEDLEMDLKKSSEFMKKYNFNHRAVIFPFGAYDERVLTVASKYYDYATGTGSAKDSRKRIVSAKSGVNNYRLGRYKLNNPFSEIKEMLDKTIEENGWLIMVGHIGQDPATEEDYRNIIEYALNNEIKIVTLDEGYRTFGNIAQFGDSIMSPATTISSEGIIDGDTLGMSVIDRSYDVVNDTPLSYFASNKITYNLIRRAQMQGFPGDGTSGVLVTVKLSEREDFWNHQIFYTTRKKEYFYRWSDGGAWTDWEKINKEDVAPPNTYTGESKISDFPMGLTISIIQAGHTEKGLPNRTGGTLITIKASDGEPRWSHQEFLEYHTGKKYIRQALQDGWGAWRQIASN